MKTSAQPAYAAMMTTAAVLARLPVETPPEHVRALAVELARAAQDLDARMRAGLALPVAWAPQRPVTLPERSGSDLPEEPAPGTVVVPAQPTEVTRGRSWRRRAPRPDGREAWVPQHGTGAAQSWAAVLDQCGGAVRVTYPAAVAARVLRRH